MPAIDNDSPPPTVDDFMDSSALAVSPILTASIFDEIIVQTSELDTDTLAISETNNPDILHRRRHHRRSHLAQQTTFAPPPPSARWRRRLERVVSSVAPTQDNEEDDEDYQSNDDGDDHIGPVMPSDMRGFPRSNSTHFLYGQNCLNDRVVNTSPLCSLEGKNSSNMLDFDVVFDDGGQYG